MFHFYKETLGSKRIQSATLCSILSPLSSRGELEVDVGRDVDNAGHGGEDLRPDPAEDARQGRILFRGRRGGDLGGAGGGPMVGRELQVHGGFGGVYKGFVRPLDRIVVVVQHLNTRGLQKLVIVPSKKDLGLAFKGNQKRVVQALEAMSEKEAMDMKAALESKGEMNFQVCTLRKDVVITKKMVSISMEKKLEHQVFIPSVVEPTFGIGRIIYCLFEQIRGGAECLPFPSYRGSYQVHCVPAGKESRV